MVDFQTGNQYTDFDPKVDKIAEYGLATLIAMARSARPLKLGLLHATWKVASWHRHFCLKESLFILAVVAIVALFKREIKDRFSGQSKVTSALIALFAAAQRSSWCPSPVAP